MPPQVLFNQFGYVDRLKSGGFTDEQARASAEALGAALLESVATSSDLAALESRLAAKIDSVERKLDAKIDSVERNLNAKIDSAQRNLNALDAKLDNSFLQLKLDIASANNAMLLKTGGMLTIIITASIGVARYFGIIH